MPKVFLPCSPVLVSTKGLLPSRYLLGLFFTHTLAIRPDHVHMVGETSKQLQELSDIIVERMESLPPGRGCNRM